jgi:hypothetical protein
MNIKAAKAWAGFLSIRLGRIEPKRREPSIADQQLSVSFT